MAVGSEELPALAPVGGVRLAAVSAGIKTPGRNDLVLVEAAPGANCAAVFTRNAFCAAPVTVAREHLAACAGQPRYLLINTGNANAGTGDAGIGDARACCARVSELADVEPWQVLPFSTGVIGEPLPVARIEAGVPEAFAALASDAWPAAAAGILTTDTRPKGCSVRFRAGGDDYVVTGIAKGAGMIRPDMATMLAFLATDMAVDGEVLRALLQKVVDVSFNRITVDGDTSTNDACVLLATGAAGNAPVRKIEGEAYGALEEALREVCVTLAQALVRDGEGATKFITVQVNGGRSERECLYVAYTISHSPLVKTALFASDPNWGRLLAAIGRAGLEDLDVGGVSVFLNDVLIAEQGGRAASYTEEQGAAAMAPEDIAIRIELGRGGAQATVWTSDLSYEYVRINAEYRT